MEMNFNFQKELLIEKGRICDVLFENVYLSNPFIMVFGDDNQEKRKIDITSIYVWADKGLQKLIENIDGVLKASPSEFNERYLVRFDPRYDREIVKKEIEAVILCHNKELEKPEKKEDVLSFIGTDFTNDIGKFITRPL